MSDFVQIRNIFNGTINATSSKIEKGGTGLVSKADADLLVKLKQAELVEKPKAQYKEKKSEKKVAAK